LLYPDVTVTSAAATQTVLTALVLGLTIGALLVVPSLALLLGLFQTGGKSTTKAR
jgi:cytochrome bd-type quinol oxidase subunit 2